MATKKSSKSREVADEGRRGQTHDQPIILDNGSIALGLDGTPPSYIEISPGHYFAAAHRVKSITIDGTPCNGMPSHRMCTIEAFGRHDTAGDDSMLTIVSAALGVTIRFNAAHYQKINGGNRKEHKSNVRRVRRLTIRDDRTGSVHVCTLPPPQTSFEIKIDDREHN